MEITSLRKESIRQASTVTKSPTIQKVACITVNKKLPTNHPLPSEITFRSIKTANNTIAAPTRFGPMTLLFCKPCTTPALFRSTRRIPSLLESPSRLLRAFISLLPQKYGTLIAPIATRTNTVHTIIHSTIPLKSKRTVEISMPPIITSFACPRYFCTIPSTIALVSPVRYSSRFCTPNTNFLSCQFFG